MHEYFYIDAAGAQSGPVSMDILLAMRLPENTLVWREGMAAWTEIRLVPELNPTTAQQPPQPQAPVYQQPAAAQPTGYQPSAFQQSFQSGTQPQEEPYYNKPDSNLVLAILCTVLCCLPFGIAAIIQATKVDSLWAARQYDAARDAADKAKKWSIWGAALSLVGAALYIIFVLALAFTGNM